MKKLGEKARRHLTRRSKQALGNKRTHRHRNTFTFKLVWYRNQFWKARILSPDQNQKFPSRLCFKSNPEETLKAFARVRKNLHRNNKPKLWFKPKLRQDSILKIKKYTSMEEVEHISTSAALVLAAEYQRRRSYMSEYAPLIGLGDWKNSVLIKLHNIGFFKEFSFDLGQHTLETEDDDVLTVPFYSGSDAAQMQQIDNKLSKLVDHISDVSDLPDEMRMALNNAVGEAALNAREHAYISDHKYEYPHVGLWWATGAASKQSREMVISLYDQGVSIPISYPKLPFFSSLLKTIHMFDNVSDNNYVNDGTLIRTAAKYGKSTRVSKVGGKGLPQIKDAINLCGGGSLMIISRGGRYQYEVKDGEETETVDTFPHSIGGTLIEWTVKLP